MKKTLLLALIFLISLPTLANGELMCKMGAEYLQLNNYKEALYWFNKAADEGNTEALHYIATCYYNGYGVTQNYKEALVWYRKAADKNYDLSQFMIGYCYYKGHGVKQSIKKAAKWYEKAAEQGLPVAQMSLAGCYYIGEEIKRNIEKAIYWWTLAAEQGDASSQYFLAGCYELGDAGAINYEEAFKWFQKAAEQGHADAQYKLGIYYRDGLGIEKKNEDAFIWLLKAADQGHSDADAALKELMEVMFAGPTTPPPPPPAPEDITIDIAPNDSSEHNAVFMVVENMPEFPGGTNALFQYLRESIKYPEYAHKKGIQGRVICQFVIERDGSIVDIVIIRSSGEQSLDNEAIRVIQSMPKWKPGMHKGKAVRVKYTIPINFRLQQM